MSDCRIWPGSTNARGYGVLSRSTGTGEGLAHRDAWVRRHGPIPAGLVVMHACDNPPCVNTEHLSVGTQAENLRDCASKGRLMSEANIAARRASRHLTDGQIADMRAAYAAGGVSTRALGERFGVTGSFVHAVVTGKRRPSEREQSEALAGPRCRHDQIGAWCSWCRGLSEEGIAFDLIGKGE